MLLGQKKTSGVASKALAATIITLFAGSSFAAPVANTGVEKDNTQINQRDSSGKTLTPEDQSRGSAMDVELTRQIRQEIVGDTSLSTDAQNVKIITLSGVVTFRGPVDSRAERAKLDSLAKKVSGVKRIDNQTEVKVK